MLAAECMLVTISTGYECYDRRKLKDVVRRTRRADGGKWRWYRDIGYIEKVLLEHGHCFPRSLFGERSYPKHQSLDAHECKLCWEKMEKVYITSFDEVYCERYVASKRS